jgi:hypothetical protein
MRKVEKLSSGSESHESERFTWELKLPPPKEHDLKVGEQIEAQQAAPLQRKVPQFSQTLKPQRGKRFTWELKSPAPPKRK